MNLLMEVIGEKDTKRIAYNFLSAYKHAGGEKSERDNPLASE